MLLTIFFSRSTKSCCGWKMTCIKVGKRRKTYFIHPPVRIIQILSTFTKITHTSNIHSFIKILKAPPPSKFVHRGSLDPNSEEKNKLIHIYTHSCKNMQPHLP